MKAIAEYRVRREADQVIVEGDGDCFTFESSRLDLYDDRIAAFAAWILLPVVMRKRKDLHILGNGDLETVANAEALSRVWAMWMPSLFRKVKVSFESYEPVEREVSDTDLLLYSGGVDSTYNLLIRHEAGLKQSLLTLHGLDYKADDFERFADMISKTDPFCKRLNCERLFLRVDAYAEYKKYGVNAAIGHGFVLASGLFLMSGEFRDGVISSDFSREQEYIAFPWGTNSVTNPYFKSEGFALKTANLEVTRAQKMELLTTNKDALDALIFCGRKAARPNNCGVCSKCMRTKAMFLAATGEIPDIFLNREMSENLIEGVDLSKRSEKAFFVDMMEMAEAKGRSSMIPGLESCIQKLNSPLPSVSGWKGWIRRVFRSA